MSVGVVHKYTPTCRLWSMAPRLGNVSIGRSFLPGQRREHIGQLLPVHRLDVHLVLPGVAEVVFIDEAITEASDGRQSELLLIELTLGILVELHAITSALHGERVQVAV